MKNEMLETQKRIAAALERIADVMEDEQKEYAEAKRMAEEAAKEHVDPTECDHPQEHHHEVLDGAFVRVGCSRCGADNIYAGPKTFRAATGLL